MLKKIKGMSWVEWGVVVAATILLLVLPGMISGQIGYETAPAPTSFSPWLLARGIEIEIAVEEFNSGYPPDQLFLEYRIMALIGILLFYLVGPGLLILYGLGSPSGENGSLAPFQAGLVLVLAGIINLGVLSVLPSMAHETARKDAANSSQKDQMRQEMFKIGQAAYEYYVLPDSLGGGGGSFAGISFSDIDAELDFPTTAYRLHPESDTLLRIVGTKPLPYPSEKKDSVRLVAHGHPNTVMEYHSE